jgi:hypothetical protein
MRHRPQEQGDPTIRLELTRQPGVAKLHLLITKLMPQAEPGSSWPK